MKLKIRSETINFGNVFCAPGTFGFYGEGYPFHRLWKHIGLTRTGLGFAGKTLTLSETPGNMPLKNDGFTPKEWNPKCIWVDFVRGLVMNAVGLSNAGARFYLDNKFYYQISTPFFLSFMPLAGDRAGREAETKEFCRVLMLHFPFFHAPVALQINFGCPNSGHDLAEFYGEICALIEIAKRILGIPVFANTNALMPTEVLIEISRIADGLWIGNTVPWKATPRINWDKIGNISPIRRRLDPKNLKPESKIDGGLSGPACLPLTIEKIAHLRNSGVTIPIVGGNGIRTRDDLLNLKTVFCDAVALGSVGLVRPKGMKQLIGAAHEYFD